MILIKQELTHETIEKQALKFQLDLSKNESEQFKQEILLTKSKVSI